MKIVREFSRFAEEYNKHNVIQVEVAKRVVSMLPTKSYKKILDLGSGSGAVYSSIEEREILFEKFIAFDFSAEMLALHPKGIKIEMVCQSFNNKNIFNGYCDNEFDILVSSSALQWSENLSEVLYSISSLAKEFYLSFFTSNTFLTLHKTAGIESPIYSKEKIVEALESVYEYDMELVEYRLNFNSTKEMFRYIKHSGVSGGSKKLTYREMKKLMDTYPLKYLEFEVVFVKAKRKI